MGKTLHKKMRGKKTFRRAVRGNFNLENLEIRRLLATVNVANYGATINDGMDDRAAILKAISASAPGDTILFNGGVFNIGDQITLASDRTYLGQNGASLKGQGVDGHSLTIKSDNITVRGLTLDGGGIFLDRPAGGKNNNITIDNNRFLQKATGSHRNGITFTSGLANSQVTNNLFTGYNGGYAIYGYNYRNVTIANNEVANTTAGFHIDAFSDAGNLVVEQNYIHGTMNMGMEFQSTASGLVFQDNWYEAPSFTSMAGTSGGNTMAYSLILDKSSNITIRRNVAIMPLKTSTDYVRITFEIGGDNCLVEDNYSYGGNHIVAMNDGVGTASATVRNNKFLNYAQGISNSYPSADRTLTQSNNGNIRLSDVMEARLAAHYTPGINQRYGSTTSTPTPTPIPTPTPTPSPATVTIPAESGVTYLSDMIASSSTNGWGPMELDRSNGELGANDGRTLTIAGRTYAKGLGVHARSEVHYNLNGGFTTFSSDIGIDAETKGLGSVAFEVWADGQLLYSSGVMKAADGYKNVQVDVTGKRDLVLFVTNAGDGTPNDHADWGNARLTPIPAPVTPPAPEPSDEESSAVYLSDLSWVGYLNTSGPVERDMSVGGTAAGDGTTLSIGGTTYAKGLGVQAMSQVRYALGGNYSMFKTDIGVDDSSQGKGAVVFYVMGDGAILYASGTMTAADGGPRSIELDVQGVNELTLMVYSAGGDSTYDRADWADARLIPTVAETAVSDIPFTVVKNGWGAAETDRSNGETLANDGKLITLNGVVYGTGLGVHAPSDIVINLNGQYVRFVSDIGIDDEVGSRGSVAFQIWGDGVLLYDSGLMTGSSATKSVDVDVAGVQQLTLKVVSPDNMNFDHADWAGATLTTAE